MKAVIDNRVHLYGDIDEKILSQIKEDLTFANKQYETVMRYSKYRYTSVPPYLFYYSLTKDELTVPVGYNFLKYFDCVEIEDERVCPPTKVVPHFALSLRESQKEAAEEFIKNNANIIPKGSIQMPTGKGKSILGLYLAHYYKTKTLIVVHKDDLVQGWKKDIDLAFDKKVVPGIIKAKSRTIGDFLTIATVQTLNRLSKEELYSLHKEFGFIIQDEMHHCPSTSFSIVNGFKCRYRLGLTATPERADGLAHVMNLYFGDFCYRYKATEEDKDILPVKVKRRKLNLYVNPVCKKIAGNYEVVDFLTPEGTNLKEGEVRISDIPYNLRPRISYQTLDDIVVRGISPAVIQDIVKEYDEGRSCVVFFTQKEHCRLYYDFLKEFISENHLGLYYGDNSDNDSVLKQAEEIRKFVTLTTYAKATEGTNVKQWEVEFLVSSVNNEKNVEQAVGRIRRTKLGKKISPAIVYDYRTPFVYSMNSHGRTRDKRYSQLGFSDYYVNAPKKNLFNRGYR